MSEAALLYLAFLFLLIFFFHFHSFLLAVAVLLTWPVSIHLLPPRFLPFVSHVFFFSPSCFLIPLQPLPRSPFPLIHHFTVASPLPGREWQTGESEEDRLRRRLSLGLSVFDFNLLYRRFVCLLLKEGREGGRKETGESEGKASGGASTMDWKGNVKSISRSLHY